MAEFRNDWMSLVVGSELEIRRELLSEGHKALFDLTPVVNSKKDGKKQKKKASVRRQKTTNLHLDYDIWSSGRDVLETIRSQNNK